MTVCVLGRVYGLLIDCLCAGTHPIVCLLVCVFVRGHVYVHVRLCGCVFGNVFVCA